MTRPSSWMRTIMVVTPCERAMRPIHHLLHVRVAPEGVLGDYRQGRQVEGEVTVDSLYDYNRQADGRRPAEAREVRTVDRAGRPDAIGVRSRRWPSSSVLKGWSSRRSKS